MTEPQVTNRGIAWRADGAPAGPALLLLGSLGTTVDIWRPQLERFAGRYRVIRLDTRGHGRSVAPPGDYTLDDLGADALSVLDAAGIERAAVCGVSLGGMTGMWLAAHAPERVRSLVPVSTALRIGRREMWDERIRQVRSGGTAGIADAAMGRWFSATFQREHPDTVDWCRTMLVGCSTEGYVGCCAALREADLHGDALRIVAPTLVIAGRHDPVTPPADAHEIADHIAGARLMTLDASHICAVERADELTSAVLAFLGSR
jgi:3-oxoadipate enol-lactonase